MLISSAEKISWWIIVRLWVSSHIQHYKVNFAVKQTEIGYNQKMFCIFFVHILFMNIFRGVRIVAVILCTTGIALLAYMDGVDPKEGGSGSFCGAT